jgi:hypothetical protein
VYLKSLQKGLEDDQYAEFIEHKCFEGGQTIKLDRFWKDCCVSVEHVLEDIEDSVK